MMAAQKAHPPLSPADDEWFGKYRLLGELASGGMARIYLASIDGPGGFMKPCVIKKVLPEFMKLPDFNAMFVNEAKVAALLNHPNIVQAFDFGCIGDQYYLALEFVEGASLATVISRARQRKIALSLNTVVHVGISLCEALAYAHSAMGTDGRHLQLIHRDVTPGNVLLSASGAVKLTDFGIVKSSMQGGLSKPDVLKGKIPYMSPEQARAEPLDGRSDLFSLALVLYEMITFKRVLQRTTLNEQVAAATTPHIPPPSTFMALPVPLERILMRALSTNRDARYATAKAMQADLESFRADQHWTSATNEVASLLSTLFPEALPNSARALDKAPMVTSLERPAEEVEPLEEEAYLEEVAEEEELDEPKERSWKEGALIVALGVALSVAVWLYVLP